MADSRIVDLRTRLERDPESRLFAQLAEELRKEGELEEAIGVARAGLARHPAYPSALLTLGRALLDSGDPAAARTELQAAVQGAPDNILASRLLGEALETLGDLGSALDQYAHTLQMAPGDGHVEARIRAIQSRLGGPEAGWGGRPGGPEPPKAVGGVNEAEDEGEDLPPTIRIRMPGDAPGGRAPLPPAPRRQATGEATLPKRSADEGRAFAPPTGAVVVGSELAGTLPMPAVERAAEANGEAPGAVPAEPGGLAGDDEAVASDLAPTLPKSRAAEFASTDGALPSTLPPGLVGIVDEAAEGGLGAEADPAATVPVEPDARALVDEGARPVSGAESPPLSSATLAELYFEQGLLERAVEVYRQVLEEEPGNEDARARLAEIEKLVAEGSAELSVPAGDIAEDPAARRRALERTIERLEALLEVVRRR